MAKQIKGILGEKLGMTQVWDENNRVVPVTVVKAGPNVVTQVRTNDADGYESVQIAFGEIDPRKVNKPLKGHFAKADVTPRRHLVEIRTADASEYTLGQEITAEVFEAGIKVDVTGKSKGKGFAGVMKRHNFRGLGAGRLAERRGPQPRCLQANLVPGVHVFQFGRRAGPCGQQAHRLERHEITFQVQPPYRRAKIQYGPSDVIELRPRHAPAGGLLHREE